MKSVYLFLHSDEWKSYSSMNPAENDTVFRDTLKGRAFLWHTIKSEINNNSIECDNNNSDKIRAHILYGNPLDANDFIKYGIILRYHIC